MEGREFHLEPIKGLKGVIPRPAGRIWNRKQDFGRTGIHTVDHHVLRKKDRIISKTASKYWQKTSKYGVLIPKTVKQAIKLDKANGDTRWWEKIIQEIKNVRPAFEVFESERKTYQSDTK